MPKYKQDRYQQRGPSARQQNRLQQRGAPQRRQEHSIPRTTGETIYGRNAVRETLRAARRKLRHMLIAEGVREDGPVAQLVALAQAAGVPIDNVQRQALDDLTNGANHQGVALDVGPYHYAELGDMLQLAQERNELPLLLLLDHLQDPQNIGTLLRTADVVGAHGVVLPDRRSAAITPAVVNASAGAVEHLLIAQVINLTQTIEELKQHNVWVAGLEDEPDAQILDQQRWDLPLALVVGAEGPGLARLVKERCDFLVRLPMAGHVASLNAATAGSIALYTVWRKRTAT
jgi:23S rRNA (guanosine2251-2'-O)-methyltransferase